MLAFDPRPFAAVRSALLLAITGSAQAADLVAKVDFLGLTTIPNAAQFDGTTVGGLSAITYDAASDRYLILSDDRSEFDPARFYTASIAIADGALAVGDVTIQAVTTLKRPDGTAFPAGSTDTEGIALANDGRLFISSEGDRSAGINPFVRRFDRTTGVEQSDLGLPAKFLVGDPVRGVRNNAALEALAITPSQNWLYTGTEQALVQDGPLAILTGSPSRLLRLDAATGVADAEFLYTTEALGSGLVELLALTDDRLLALERGFSPGLGSVIRLFEIDLAGATDIRGIDSLTTNGLGGIIGARKRLVANLADFGFTPDNVEGMTLGPTLADGRRTLILVSDDNFSATQTTQVIALGLTVVPEPGSAALTGAGLGGLLLLAARKARR